MDQGRVVESGSHSDLLLLDDRYAKLYREQFLTAATNAEPDGIQSADR
jgi:hypothetical protein